MNGNAPFLVFDDTDLDSAVEDALSKGAKVVAGYLYTRDVGRIFRVANG